jgi:hypothetical protein
VKNGLGGCTRRARSLPSSYIGLAALSLTRLFLSSPPACVSFRESCNIVFTALFHGCAAYDIRDVHMCKGVYSSVFIMKNGLRSLPRWRLRAATRRSVRRVDACYMYMGGPQVRIPIDRSGSLTLGSVRKCEL